MLKRKRLNNILVDAIFEINSIYSMIIFDDINKKLICHSITVIVKHA